jgi:hypothetical protein
VPEEYPRLVRFLVEKLGVRLRKRDKALDYEFFLLDLSGWKLRLSDRTPFLRVTAQQLQSLPAGDLVASIRAAIHKEHLNRHLPIVVAEGCVPDLRESLARHVPYSAFLDDADVDLILAAASSERRFLDLLCEQLPLESLAPYEISSPVTGSRFFGREYEIRTILNHPQTDYAIVGVRRIGKTSLLLEVKRRLQELGEDGVHFFDCSDFHSADDYIQAVATEVDIRQRERMTLQKFPNFLRIKSYQGKRPLIFLLDEVDRLVAFDRLENWALLNMLRASSIKGFCRYILTGYRSVLEESLKEQAPLYNFSTALPLGSLSRSETERLVTVPLENLGVAFERRAELVGQIAQQTAGHPNFVQFYCHTLVQLLDREGRRCVSPGDLAAVHSDQEFERYVFRTFTANTTDLEKAVVYGIVMDRDESFTPRDVDVCLKKRKVFAAASEIEQALDNLRTACVLEKQGQTFSFAVPILPRLLRDHYDLDYLFSKAREDAKRGGQDHA